MPEIKLIDTTLRDGQMSLWAMNARTEDLLPALQAIDGAGFESTEFWVPTAHIYKAARDLRQNALHWLHQGALLARHTRLRLIGGMASAFVPVPRSVVRLLFEKAVDAGVAEARISDWWNDYQELEPDVRALNDVGLDVIVNLIYSVSPKHTDEYYLERAATLARMRPYRVCFKDVGGLLTPERLCSLLPKLTRVLGDIPLELHGHCNNTMAPIYYLEAAKLGVKYLNTAIPPLAYGSSQPSVFNIVRNLATLGYDVDLDEELVRRASRHLEYVARRDDLPIGSPGEYDEALYRHQVPGGMMSTLRFQLEEAGQAHRLEEVLEEAGRVRAEFGYPIMVTPLSQFVGTQAALNVITGDRYSVIPDGVIEYALGRWGTQAVADMDQNIRDKIIDRPRAQELPDFREPLDEPLEAVRSRFGSTISDEELIIRAYAGEYAERALENATPPTVNECFGSNPVMDLIGEIAKTQEYRSVQLQRGNFKLLMSRTSE